MRILIALPMLALAACQVSKDDANDTISMTYNEEVAENAAADAGNFAEAVANDVQEGAAKVTDKIENTDVDVDVKTDGNKAEANAN
jgi:hypothetical protein